MPCMARFHKGADKGAAPEQTVGSARAAMEAEWPRDYPAESCMRRPNDCGTKCTGFRRRRMSGAGSVGQQTDVTDERHPPAGQLVQLALGSGGDEARPRQAVAEQLGDPLGVADVGLATGHRLQVGGVDDEQLETATRPSAPPTIPPRTRKEAGRGPASRPCDSAARHWDGQRLKEALLRRCSGRVHLRRGRCRRPRRRRRPGPGIAGRRSRPCRRPGSEDPSPGRHPGYRSRP